MKFLNRHLLAVSVLIATAPLARADEPNSNRTIAVQQALIAQQKSTIESLQTSLVSLQAQVKTNEEALRKLTDRVIRDGRVVADYAASAENATNATNATNAGYAANAGNATRASSAESSSFCNALRSDGSNNTITMTWQGSSLHFNIDTYKKVKTL